MICDLSPEICVIREFFVLSQVETSAATHDTPSTQLHSFGHILSFLHFITTYETQHHGYDIESEVTTYCK